MQRSKTVKKRKKIQSPSEQEEIEKQARHCKKSFLKAEREGDKRKKQEEMNVH